MLLLTIGSGHIYCETNPPQSDFCSSLSPPTAQVNGELQAAKSSGPCCFQCWCFTVPPNHLYLQSQLPLTPYHMPTCLLHARLECAFAGSQHAKNVTLDFPSLLTFLPHSPVSEQPAPPPSGSHYTVKMSPVIQSLRRVGRVAPWVLFSHSSNSYLGNCTTRLILLLLL